MLKVLAQILPKYAVRRALLSAFAIALSTQAAIADWRTDIGVLRIGIAAHYGQTYEKEALEPFRALMSQVLQMPVEIYQARDSSTLIDAMASSRIEYAIMTSLGYATLSQLCNCVVPLVAPRTKDGATSVRSELVVNANKIETLAQLRGKKVAIGPQTSLTGRLLPQAQFKINGNSLEDASVLTVSTQTLDEAYSLFESGQVDAFFNWASVIAGTDKTFDSAISQKLNASAFLEYKTLWFSTPIRFGPHAIRKNLNKEAVAALKTALLEMHDTAPAAYNAAAADFGGGFIAVEPEDFATSVSLVTTLATLEENDQTWPISK